MPLPHATTPRPKPRLTPEERAVGQRLLLWCLLPLAGPMVLSIGLVLQTLWQPLPTLAPGQAWQLALPGGSAALLGWLGVLRWLWRGTPRADWRRAGAVLSLVTSLLATPVWALGVMQWVNGQWPGAVQATRVRLDGLSTSPRSKSREPYRWAHLPGDAGAGLPPGKYLLDADHHAAWTERRPPSVTVHHARGLLGARVVAGWSD